MGNEITFQEVNAKLISLVQALLGSISPNFRAVILEYLDEVWWLTFILEQDNPEDQEEIVEITTVFEGFQEGSIDYEVVIEITDKDLHLPMDTLTRRCAYRRRER
ncbi:MAG: hypothetical protein KC445_17680 [Anaerolineales bacterium]|nr:hypothetical protein [Anaerolineales bacterium]